MLLLKRKRASNRYPHGLVQPLAQVPAHFYNILMLGLPLSVFEQLEQVDKDIIVWGVSPGLPLDNATPLGALPYIQGPVLAVCNGPDFNFNPIPRGTFLSNPRFFSFSQ